MRVANIWFDFRCTVNSKTINWYNSFNFSIDQCALVFSPKSSNKSEPPALVGYFQNVSPTRVISKGSWILYIYRPRERCRQSQLFFPPQETQIDCRNESQKQHTVKINKFVDHVQEENVVGINYNTEINDASELIFPVNKTLEIWQSHLYRKQKSWKPLKSMNMLQYAVCCCSEVMSWRKFQQRRLVLNWRATLLTNLVVSP